RCRARVLPRDTQARPPHGLRRALARGDREPEACRRVTDVGIGLWGMQSSATRPAPYAALYRDFVDAAVIADELDFHAVWLAEHRLWYDGYCPALLHAEAAAASR